MAKSEETCPCCGQKRLPRYKTDKSWAKHQEFCQGAKNSSADAASDAARPQAAQQQTNSHANASVNIESTPTKQVAPVNTPAVPGSVSRSLSDLPQLLANLSKQLACVDFKKVQLGVTLGEREVDEGEPPAKRAKTDEARVSDESNDADRKREVLEMIRLEFIKLHPEAEIVSQEPDLNILFNMATWQFLPPVPTAIYLYGRYKKLERGIPQTRWLCSACRGDKLGRYSKRDAASNSSDRPLPGASSTCEACKGSGLQYADSVQDLLGKCLVDMLGGEDSSFHGMGREDIDVRCLGRGRPFVMEIKAPRKRRALQDLDALAAAMQAAAPGRVELAGPLRLSSRAEPARLKSAEAEKTYTIRFRVDGGVKGASDEQAILSLAGKVLDQRTPTRVEHRRADLVRKRSILELGPLVVDGDEVELTIRAESGSYIKEFVHSDDGRTVPSVAGTLGRRCEVLWLDVKDIHAD